VTFEDVTGLEDQTCRQQKHVDGSIALLRELEVKSIAFASAAARRTWRYSGTYNYHLEACLLRFQHVETFHGEGQLIFDFNLN
jgi:hypothetical protein